MAEFLDNLSKKFTQVTEDVTKKAEDTIEVQRLKSNIRTLTRATERDYIAMGKMVYEKVQAEEITEDCFTSLCADIAKREEEIAGLEVEISKIEGK